MPEGDTVLRTARRLDAALSGRRLTRTEFRWPTLGEVDLAGREVLTTVAYGKQILTRLAPAPEPIRRHRIPTAPDGPLTLRSHLRMEGRWAIFPPGERSWPKRIGPSVRAVLANDDWTAVGTWLGLLDLLPTADEHVLLGHLGPDLLAPDGDGALLAAGAERIAAWPDRTIGAALLDQTGVAGIGTMYMAETLFLQRDSPWLRVAEVDVASVLRRARTLLTAGVRSANPTTTGFPDSDRRTWVHGRSGRPCLRCGTTVRVAPIGDPPRDRPAFYCPMCQPGPTPTDSGRPLRPLGANPAYREERRPMGYRR